MFFEQRVPQDHPLREVRKLTDRVLGSLSAEFNTLYSASGRPSIAPEYVLRELLLQVFYSVRSERQWVEQIDYNLLFRWFVGSVALTCWAAGHLRDVPSSCDREDLEELVDKAHFVPDVLIASEAMSSTDHPHPLETLDGSGCCSHRLKSSGRSNDLLECAMVRLDDVVQVFAGPMSCVSRQLAFPLQAIDSLRV